MKFLPLKKKKDFLRALKTGKRIFAPSLTAVFLPAQDSRFAVCVGKKYGKSVKRNRVKRLLREAFRLSCGNFPYPCHILLIPKVEEEYSFRVFRRDVGIVLSKGSKIHGGT